MAASATKAMAKFLKTGRKTVAPTVYEERLQTCAGCAYHSGLRCRVCGCFTNMKARLPHETCPVGKWPVYVDLRGTGQTTEHDPGARIPARGRAPSRERARVLTHSKEGQDQDQDLK